MRLKSYLISCRVFLTILKYHFRIFTKRARSKWIRTGELDSAYMPPVTVFISTMNTRYALEMTLRSLIKYTAYSPIKFRIADNCSTDGTIEFLENFAHERTDYQFTVVRSAKPKPHSEWLEETLRGCDTEYLFAIDSDMLFLGSDPIAEMVSAMVFNTSLYFLSSGLQPVRHAVVEPIGQEVVDQAESPHTWLMCIRCSLVERLDVSFAVRIEPRAGGAGRPVVNDTGATLLGQMRSASLQYGVMPEWFLNRFEHIGSMSWKATNLAEQSPQIRFKSYKAADVMRRAKKLAAAARRFKAFPNCHLKA